MTTTNMVAMALDPAAAERALAADKVAAAHVVGLATTSCITTGTTEMMNTVAGVKATVEAAEPRVVRLAEAEALVLVRVRHQADRAVKHRKVEVYTEQLT